MGDGFKVRFWHDLWWGDTALKEVFPILLDITRIKDASVATLVECYGGAIQ